MDFYFSVYNVHFPQESRSTHLHLVVDRRSQDPVRIVCGRAKGEEFRNGGLNFWNSCNRPEHTRI